MGICRDDHLVLGVCYTQRGEEGDGVEDPTKESGRGRYDVIMSNAIVGIHAYA